MKQCSNRSKRELHLKSERDVDKDHPERHEQPDAALIRELFTHSRSYKFCPTQVQFGSSYL